MALIDYYVHGRGRGHATRALTVARALEVRGHALRLFGGGEATDILTGDDRWTPRAPILPGARVPLLLASRTAHDLRRLGERPPDLIVSDGDQAIILAARARGIPCVAVGHDLTFTSCRLPRTLPRASVLYQKGNALIPTSFASWRVPVHFLPIAAERPRTTPSRHDLHAELTGPVGSDPFIVCYLSGYPPEPILERLLASRSREVLYFGHGATARPGLRVAPVSRSAFGEALRRCEAVVATAGDNLLAECIMLGKPVLALHDRRHREQSMNARLAEDAGVALRSSFDEFSADTVRSFLDRVRRSDFARVELASAVRAVSDVVGDVVRDLLEQAADRR